MKYEKAKSNPKINKLFPSTEGIQNSKKISQTLDAKNISEKAETPFALVACNQFLDILGFDTMIKRISGGIRISGKFRPVNWREALYSLPF